MIAAYLNPTDAEEWAKLAQMSLELGRETEAIACYDKGTPRTNTHALTAQDARTHTCARVCASSLLLHHVTQEKEESICARAL